VELRAQAARQAAQRGSGVATAADSLPPDPSKHT
jgi:hypothetical protein